MTATPVPRFTLDHDGHRFAVESESAGLQTLARLFVDGEQVDEKKGMDKKITLEGGGLIVVVKLTFLGAIDEILAVPVGTDPKKAAEEGVAFAAPAGSRAARMEELRRTRPTLYAARHVAMAVLQVAIGVFGIGALLWGLVEGLLPRINFPDIPLPDLPNIPWPDIDLPAIPWPDLPLPAIVLPDLSHLAWIKDLLSSLNWLVPIVIAIVVALNELDKRRKREKAAKRRQLP